jgi:hypothetical protein
MPGQLATHLSGLMNSTEIAAIYGSITTAATYPPGSPVHEGVVAAYTRVMLILLIPATVFAIVPVVAALMLDDVHLGDTQNAVEAEGDVALPRGEAVVEDRESIDKVQA